jgi:hypothetical protein
MAFVLIIIGVVLLVTSVRNTVTAQGNIPGLFTLLQGDFTGPDNFIFWMLSILAIGALGYVPKLKPLSVAFLSLVIVVLFLKRGDSGNAGGGFFSQVLSGLNTTQTQQPVQSQQMPIGATNPQTQVSTGGMVGVPSLSTTTLQPAGGFTTPAATAPFVPSPYSTYIPEQTSE